MITLCTLSLLCLAVILVLGVVLTILSVPFLVILGLLPWLLRIAAAVLLIRGLLDHPFRWGNLIPAAVAFGLSVLLH